MWEFDLKTNVKTAEIKLLRSLVGYLIYSYIYIYIYIYITQLQNKPINNRTITYNLNDKTVYYRRKWAQCLSRINYVRFPDGVYEETWSTKEMVKRSLPMKMEQARNWLISCLRRWAVQTTYSAYIRLHICDVWVSYSGECDVLWCDATWFGRDTNVSEGAAHIFLSNATAGFLVYQNLWTHPNFPFYYTKKYNARPTLYIAIHC